MYFRTKSLVELKPLADMFLDSNGFFKQKLVPSNIAEHFSLQGLAPPVSLAGLSDDGMQVKRGGVTLCTDSFSSGQHVYNC